METADAHRPVHPAQLKKIKTSNANLFFAALPLYVMGTFFYGFSALFLGGIAALAGVGFELLAAKMQKRKADNRDLSSPALAVILTLMLPATSPVWLVLLGCFVALAIAKYPFGGTGSYVFHPVAVAYSFLAISFPDLVFKYPVPFQSTGIWSNIPASGMSYGPETALRLGGVPGWGHLKVLVGDVPGPIGAACGVVVLSCFVYLLITKAVDWKVILPFFATTAIMALLFPRVTTGRMDSLYYELFSGTVIFCGIFLASNFTTNPKKHLAKIIYAVTLGITTMLFQYFGAVQHGFCFALLLCNAATPLFDSIATKSRWDSTWAEVKPQ